VKERDGLSGSLDEDYTVEIIPLETGNGASNNIALLIRFGISTE
jgi:hypothetical protein